MIKKAVKKLAQREHLTFKESYQAFNDILSGQATPVQIASFLTALRLLGETVEEMIGAVKIVQNKALPFNFSKEKSNGKKDTVIMDTCGTGGSGVNKFNVSTAVAFVLHSAGILIAKHGNRAASSSVGSADVLEQLGIRIDIEPKLMEAIAEMCGFAFLFAPKYHPAFKNVVQVRRELGFSTIFNFIGPLCNPAQINYHILGCSDINKAKIMAEVFLNLKQLKKAFIIHGTKIKDEISLWGDTYCWQIEKGVIKKFKLSVTDFGLKEKKSLAGILVSSKEQSAQKIIEVLEGKKGVARDLVLVNAAAGLKLIGKVKSWKEGVEKAAYLIDQGKAYNSYQLIKQTINKILGKYNKIN